MATRERKAKLNAESPTPNSTSSDSASTPTTPTSVGRKTIGKRGRSGAVANITPLPKEKQTDADEEDLEEEEIVVDDVDDNVTVIPEETINKPKVGRPTRSVILDRRQIGTRTSVMKRRSLPEGRRYVRATTRRNSTGKVELIKKVLKVEASNDELVKPTEVKKTVGRPRKLISTPEIVPLKRKRLLTDIKEKKPEKFMKLDESDVAVSDSELTKLRRNSDSASKCSDMTDRDSLYDSPLFKDPDKEIENNNQDHEDLFREHIKEELIDDESSNLSGKSKESKINSETDNLDKIPLRRSRRPRKSTLKDRDPPTTPKSKQIDIKTEPTTPSTCLDEASIDSTAVSSEDGGEVITPLHVETESKNIIPIIVETDKASSLSPELESEGVSVISVKQFCGEPAFLENNLGIEKDPKLGEIILDKGAEGETEEDVTNDDTNEIDDKKIEDEHETIPEETEDNEKEIFEDAIEELPKEDDDEEALVIDETVQDAEEKEVEEEMKSTEKPVTELKEIIEEKIVESVEVDTKSIIDDQDKVENEKPVIKSNESETVNEEKLKINPPEPDEDQNTNSSMETVQIEKIEEEELNETKIEVDINVEKKEKIENQEMESDNKENVESKSLDVENHLDDGELKENNDDSSNETPEAIKQKESHLKSLGLLTLKAADEAKIEKLRRKELLQTTTTTSTVPTSTPSTIASQQQQQQQQQQTKLVKVTQKGSNEYTGTLKTVIKLHRPNPEKRKRLPLKMTFQKGRGKQDNCLPSGTVEETYYTIQNEVLFSFFLFYLNYFTRFLLFVPEINF